MLKFAFFEDFDPERVVAAPLAYLISKEQLAVSARITMSDHELVCEPPGPEAAALAIQILTEGVGRLTLQTCLLPQREQPYLLPLELARHRVMLFLNKLEEWGMADLPPEHPVLRDFNRARQLFTEALVAHRGTIGEYMPEQSRLAHESLSLCIRASEDLALLHAQRRLLSRYDAANESDLTSLSPDKPSPPLPAQIGCTVHNDQFGEPLQRIVGNHFDFIACPMRWDEMEREEGVYAFGGTDRWIEWAVRTAKLPVVGGPLIDLASRSVPKWLYIWEHDYRTLREFAYEHIKRVVTRYRKTVNRWTVVSGVNINSEFTLTIEQMLDLTRLGVLLVRKLHPKAKVIVEIAQPFGEHGTHVDRSVPPLLYAELIKESGIAIDGYALRLQFGDCEPGHSTRDLMQLADMIDQLAGLDRAIHITALGAPSESAARVGAGSVAAPQRPGSAADPGYWRSPWSAETQVEWLRRAMVIALSHPSVQSVCWQTLFDTVGNKEMAGGGLISSEGRAKPVLKWFGEAASAHRAGRAPIDADVMIEEAAGSSHAAASG